VGVVTIMSPCQNSQGQSMLFVRSVVITSGSDDELANGESSFSRIGNLKILALESQLGFSGFHRPGKHFVVSGSDPRDNLVDRQVVVNWPLIVPEGTVTVGHTVVWFLIGHLVFSLRIGIRPQRIVGHLVEHILLVIGAGICWLERSEPPVEATGHVVLDGHLAEPFDLDEWAVLVVVQFADPHLVVRWILVAIVRRRPVTDRTGISSICVEAGPCPTTGRAVNVNVEVYCVHIILPAGRSGHRPDRRSNTTRC